VDGIEDIINIKMEKYYNVGFMSYGSFIWTDYSYEMAIESPGACYQHKPNVPKLTLQQANKLRDYCIKVSMTSNKYEVREIPFTCQQDCCKGLRWLLHGPKLLLFTI
jgi:hypothetical protein